jgi:hypothetical protein
MTGISPPPLEAKRNQRAGFSIMLQSVRPDMRLGARNAPYTHPIKSTENRHGKNLRRNGIREQFIKVHVGRLSRIAGGGHGHAENRK